MLQSPDLDSVLNDAQQAVDSLASDVARLDGEPPAVAAATAEPAAEAKRATGSAAANQLNRILRIRVPVAVQLAERPMMVSEVLKFSPGSIIEFSRRVDDELDLMIGHRQIGGGIAVKCNEHYGLKITYVGDMRERIASLAG